MGAFWGCFQAGQLVYDIFVDRVITRASISLTHEIHRLTRTRNLGILKYFYFS